MQKYQKKGRLKIVDGFMFLCIGFWASISQSLKIPLDIFSVGYDDRRMMLDGRFSYDEENQRALPFGVKIRELSEEKKTFIGSTSKSKYDMNRHRIFSQFFLNLALL